MSAITQIQISKDRTLQDPLLLKMGDIKVTRAQL